MTTDKNMGMNLSDKPFKEEVGFPSVYSTKLHPPKISNDQIIRTAIVQKLEENLEKPLSLIAAPAGYGKSQTVGQWIHETNTKSCWISLDEEHNNLRVFLTYFVKAMDKMMPGSLPETALIVRAQDLPPLQAIAFTLINELDVIEENFIIVLDDYHRINDKNIHALLDQLLLYPPQKMHLSIITRRDPPLKLNSLLAKSRMVEIRMRELAFSEHETAELFEKLFKIRLTDNTIKLLNEKTEGWVVALRIASLLIRDQKDSEKLLVDFSGDVYSLSTYLLEEVLSKQSPAHQEILVKSSILDSLSAQLIDTLLDSNQSGPLNGSDFIDWLVKMNLFIIPLDFEGTWYRFHHLIQEFLYSLLKRKYDNHYISTLRNKASQWLEEHGDIGEAIQQLVLAENYEGACQIIVRNRIEQLNLDRWYVVEQWLSQIPDQYSNHPALLLSKSWAAYEQFQLEKIPALLDRIQALLADSKNDSVLWGEWHLMWGLLLHWSGNGEAALEHFGKSRALLPEEENLATGMLHLHIALARGATGQFDLAISDINKQLRVTVKEGTYKTRLVAGLFYNYQFAGYTSKAREAGRKSQRIAKKSGIQYTEAMAICQEATACFSAFQIPETLKLCEKAAKHRFIIHRQTAIDTMITRVISHELNGQPKEADKSLMLLEVFIKALGEIGLQDYVHSCKVRLGVLRGFIDPSLAWIHSYTAEPSFAGLFVWCEVPLFTQARALITMGTVQSLKRAQAILNKVSAAANTYHLTCQKIEILVLQTLLFSHMGALDKSREALQKALTLADSRRYIRPFIEVGPKMRALLTDLKGESDSTEFIDLLISLLDTSFLVPDTTGPVDRDAKQVLHPKKYLIEDYEPITAREKEVVSFLAGGYRNREIADKLFVSEGTVKKHLYNIGKKWDVHSRLSIIQKAQELNYF